MRLLKRLSSSRSASPSQDRDEDHSDQPSKKQRVSAETGEIGEENKEETSQHEGEEEEEGEEDGEDGEEEEEEEMAEDDENDDQDQDQDQDQGQERTKPVSSALVDLGASDDEEALAELLEDDESGFVNDDTSLSGPDDIIRAELGSDDEGGRADGGMGPADIRKNKKALADISKETEKLMQEAGVSARMVRPVTLVDPSEIMAKIRSRVENLKTPSSLFSPSLSARNNYDEDGDDEDEDDGDDDGGGDDDDGGDGGEDGNADDDQEDDDDEDDDSIGIVILPKGGVVVSTLDNDDEAAQDGMDAMMAMTSPVLKADREAEAERLRRAQVLAAEEDEAQRLRAKFEKSKFIEATETQQSLHALFDDEASQSLIMGLQRGNTFIRPPSTLPGQAAAGAIATAAAPATGISAAAGLQPHPSPTKALTHSLRRAQSSFVDKSNDSKRASAVKVVKGMSFVFSAQEDNSNSCFNTMDGGAADSADPAVPAQRTLSRDKSTKSSKEKVNRTALFSLLQKKATKPPTSRT